MDHIATPVEFLEKLAALTPRPKISLARYPAYRPQLTLALEVALGFPDFL